jgi:hypothetical protein
MILALLFSSLCFGSQLMGNEGGHGGDTYALEFATLGQKIAQELNLEDNQQLMAKWQLSATTLKTTVQNTLVYSSEEDQVKLRGQIVDAINYPESKKIILNRTRWREAVLSDKLKLVLHEYFGIIGVERDTYTASVEFVGALKSLHKKLLNNLADSPIRYYGRSVGSPPLNIFTNICDTKISSIADAKGLAENEALAKCQAERQQNCEIAQTEMRELLSKEMVGFRYCEVTAIAQ